MINHTVLQKFYEATKIPLQLFDDSLHIKNYGLGDFNPNPAVSIVNLAANIPNPVCFTVSSEYLFYGLIRIHNSSKHLIVGPGMSFECTQRQAADILTDIQQPINRIDELLRWLRTIPKCNLHRFREILCFLDYILNGTTKHDPIHISYQASSLPIPTINTSPLFIEQVNKLLANQMLSHVEYGNSNALKVILNNLDSEEDGLPEIASDAVRSFKNIFILATGLTSSAATKGGLEHNTAAALTETYLIQIEMLDNHTDIFNLFKHMILDYTQRTAQSRSFLSDSLLVNKIHKDVQAHLYEKVTPTGISKRLKMNSSYLSRHFKQETGKTITEFINETKVNEGKRLLEITEMPLIRISVQLGFSSQNYFHTVFKKVTGMTPLEYRNKT